MSKELSVKLVKPSVKKVITIKLKSDVISNTELAKSQAVLAIRAMRISAKKKGEGDSRIIIALLASYMVGTKVINSSPCGATEQPKCIARNNTILSKCFNIAELDVNSTKTKLVPILNYDVSDISKMKAAITRVTPFVMYIIKNKLFKDIQLTSQGILKVTGRVLIGINDLINVSECVTKEYILDGKSFVEQYTNKDGKLVEIKGSKSLATVTKKAINSLGITKVKRNVSKPIMDMSTDAQTLSAALKITAKNLISLKTPNDLSKDQRELVKEITLHLMRLNNFTDVIVDNDKVININAL